MTIEARALSGICIEHPCLTTNIWEIRISNIVIVQRGRIVQNVLDVYRYVKDRWQSICHLLFDQYYSGLCTEHQIDPKTDAQGLRLIDCKKEDIIYFLFKKITKQNEQGQLVLLHKKSLQVSSEKYFQIQLHSSWLNSY